MTNKNIQTFSVAGNWLYQNGTEVPEVKSKVKKFSQGKNICDFIIIHYTAADTALSSHNNFQNPETKVSWHLTIDQNAVVHQLYDFRKITWHAGKSSWRTATQSYDQMNPVSIGIELVNAGPLLFKNGSYYTWYNKMIPDSMVFFDANGNPWHAFTHNQLQTAWNICSVLCKEYKCIDILGHNEISPGRKQDPGEACKDFMQQIKQALRNGTL